MSILIKGAVPPSGCVWCYFNEDSKCALIAGCELDETNGTQRRKDCPLIELPDHGRLGDLDQMAFDESEAYISAQNKFKHDDLTRMLNEAVHLKVRKLIADTPTIIPAERSEE